MRKGYVAEYADRLRIRLMFFLFVWAEWRSCTFGFIESYRIADDAFMGASFTGHFAPV